MPLSPTEARTRRAARRLEGGRAPHCRRLAEPEISFLAADGQALLATGGTPPRAALVETARWQRLTPLPSPASVDKTRRFTVVGATGGAELLVAPRGRARSLALTPVPLAGRLERLLASVQHDTLLLTLRPPEAAPHGSPWANHWFDLSAGQILRTEACHGTCSSDAWSPSGASLGLSAWSRGARTVRVVARDGRPRATLPGDDVCWYGWLPGDRMLWRGPGGRGNTLRHWVGHLDGAGTALSMQPLQLDADVRLLRRSDDGSAHAFVGAAGLLVLRSAENGRQRLLGPFAPDPVHGPLRHAAWDARQAPGRLALACGGGQAWVVELREGRVRPLRLPLAAGEQVLDLEWMAGTDAWALSLQARPQGTVFRQRVVVACLRPGGLRELASVPLYASSGFPNGDPIEHPLRVSPDGCQLLVPRLLGGTHVLDWSRPAGWHPPLDRSVNHLALRALEAYETWLVGALLHDSPLTRATRFALLLPMNLSSWCGHAWRHLWRGEP